MQCLMLPVMLPVCIWSRAHKRTQGATDTVVTQVGTEGYWWKLMVMTAFSNNLGLLLLFLHSCLSYKGTMDKYLTSLAWAEQIRIPAAGFLRASQELISKLLLRALHGCKTEEVMALILHRLTCSGNNTGPRNHSREAQTLRSLRLF